jgi:hypothetical protein
MDVKPSLSNSWNHKDFYQKYHFTFSSLALGCQIIILILEFPLAIKNNLNFFDNKYKHLFW